MKICSKCREEKEDSEFYKDKRTSTGLYSACKKCSYTISRLYLEKSGNRYNYVYKNLHKRTEYQKKYQLEYQRKTSGSIEKKTRERTKFLIRSGKLKRGNCEVCGFKNAEAHHTEQRHT